MALALPLLYTLLDEIYIVTRLRVHLFHPNDWLSNHALSKGCDVDRNPFPSPTVQMNLIDLSGA